MSSSDRKARLKSLREAAAKKEEEQAQEENINAPLLKFRNYGVKDASIKHEKVRWISLSFVSSFARRHASSCACIHAD